MLWHIVAIALAAAGASAAATWQVQDWRHGRKAAEIQAVTATAREEAMHAGLVETSRRLGAQEKVTRDAQAHARRASADRAAADAVAGQLQQYADSLASACAADPAAAGPGSAASAPGLVLADMQRRLEAAGRELAAEADRRGAAGSTCERSYDALRD
jgi:hypothetical protein